MVLARNIYGDGAISEVTTVIPDDKPGKGVMPTVALNPDLLTEVLVSWEAPDAHSSPIEQYEVQFQKADGSFAPELTRCDGMVKPPSSVVTARKCSVPMTTLRTLLGPNVARDSLIRVRVRAVNAKGTGLYSELNTAGATIETEPTNLSQVSIDVPSTSNTATKVVWTALTGSARGGRGVAITQYEVYWDEAKTPTVWVSLANITGATTLERLVTGLTGGTTYQFKVRAYNKYGEGEFFPSISLQTSQRPDKPVAPTIVVTEAHVKVSWDKPITNHREVTEY